MSQERAVLAGGCFWGVQDLIRRYDGVLSTRAGYTGGASSHATYRNHGGHAEALEILFDPERVSYRQLLEFFFQIHDPSTRNRQGNDMGTSYRSAIFYTSDEQKRIAEDTIADVDASGLWPGKVVTEVVPAGEFWEAEPEHQDYLLRYPGGYTCHFVRPNWKLPRRAVNTRLSPEFIGRQRERLEALRTQLLSAEGVTLANEQASQLEHRDEAGDLGDKAQPTVEGEVYQALHDVQMPRLRNIDRALEKIAQGSYGLSDASGEPIPKARLEAIPEAVITVEEAQGFHAVGKTLQRP
jgi:peptide-methionine (S)-S-oxide reductase